MSEDLLKRKRKYKFLWAIAIILAPIIIGVGMSVINIGPGSDDGWLGFWGGYIGSVLTMMFPVWLTFEERKENEKKEKVRHAELFELERNKYIRDEVNGLYKRIKIVVHQASNYYFDILQITSSDLPFDVNISDKEIDVINESFDKLNKSWPRYSAEDESEVMGIIMLDKMEENIIEFEKAYFNFHIVAFDLKIKINTCRDSNNLNVQDKINLLEKELAKELEKLKIEHKKISKECKRIIESSFS